MLWKVLGKSYNGILLIWSLKLPLFSQVNSFFIDCVIWSFKHLKGWLDIVKIHLSKYSESKEGCVYVEGDAYAHTHCFEGKK